MPLLGHPDARIGIIYELGYVKGQALEDSAPTTSSKLHWGIQESGFTDLTVLAWAVALHEYNVTLQSSQVKPLTLKEKSAIQEANFALIQQSNLKVVLIWRARSRAASRSPAC